MNDYYIQDEAQEPDPQIELQWSVISALHACKVAGVSDADINLLCYVAGIDSKIILGEKHGS